MLGMIITDTVLLVDGLENPVGFFPRESKVTSNSNFIKPGEFIGYCSFRSSWFIKIFGANIVLDDISLEVSRVKWCSFSVLRVLGNQPS